MRTLFVVKPSSYPEIVKRYQLGESASSLADYYGITASHMTDLLKKNKVVLRPLSGIPPSEHVSIIQRYKNGEPLDSIGHSYGCCFLTIRKILVESGVYNYRRRYQEAEQVEQIVNRYQSGESLKDLMRVFRIGRHKLKIVLKNVLRSRTILSEESKNAMVFDYQQGESQQRLKQKYRCSILVVKKTLKSKGVAIRASVKSIDSSKRQAIASDYLKGVPIKEIIEKFNCTEKRLSDFSKTNGLRERRRLFLSQQRKKIKQQKEFILEQGRESRKNLQKSYFTEERISQIINRYSQGEEIKKIIPNQWVATIFRKLMFERGVLIKSKARRFLNADEISKDYLNGLSAESVAKKHKSTRSVVMSILKENRIPRRKPIGYFDSFCRSTSRSAKQRGISFNLSPRQIEIKWEAQNHLCALTGVKLELGRHHLQGRTASMDRIDSSKGYEDDNIWFTHKRINKMKGAMSLSDFIRVCKEITQWTTQS